MNQKQNTNFSLQHFILKTKSALHYDKHFSSCTLTRHYALHIQQSHTQPQIAIVYHSMLLWSHYIFIQHNYCVEAQLPEFFTIKAPKFAADHPSPITGGLLKAAIPHPRSLSYTHVVQYSSGTRQNRFQLKQQIHRANNILSPRVFQVNTTLTTKN